MKEAIFYSCDFEIESIVFGTSESSLCNSVFLAISDDKLNFVRVLIAELKMDGFIELGGPRIF